MLKLLFNNCGLKLLAIVCAAMLSIYVYIYVNPPVNQSLFLPVRVRALSDEFALAGSQPEIDKVRVRVRGPLRSVRQLAQRRMAAVLDCSDVSAAGAQSVRVTLPELGDAVVADVTPPLYTLQIEPRLAVTLPVGIDRRGQVADGFVLTNEVVTPGHVTLSGPTSIVATIHVAQVEPDLQSISANLTQEQPIHFYGADGTVLNVPVGIADALHAKYAARISPKSSVRVVTLIPEFTGTLPADLLLVSSTPRPQVVPVDIAVAGNDVLFARTEPIDLGQIKQSASFTVKVEYPFKVPQHSTLPDKCDVDIVVQPFDKLAAQRVKIELLGVQAKQECVVNPPELVLRSAEVAELTDKQRSAIRAVVDVTGLKPGEYRLAPQLFLPGELDRIKLDPTTVQVTIIPQGG